MKEIADDKAQCHQREKITQSTACLDHLQLVRTQVNDITFQEYADIKKTDYPDTELRGDQLQLVGYFLQKELRQRDHEYEQRQGGGDDFEGLPPHECQSDSCQDNQKCILHHKEERAQVPKDQQTEPEDHYHDTQPRASKGRLLQLGSFLPDEEEGDHRDQIAVAVFLPAAPDTD